MDQEALISTINELSFLSLVVLIVLAFARMFYRAGRFLFLHEKVPLLLKRDLLLFSVLAVYVGLGFLHTVVLDVTLSDSLIWAVGSAITLNGALIVWVYIEYFRIDD